MLLHHNYYSTVTSCFMLMVRAGMTCNYAVCVCVTLFKLCGRIGDSNK